MGKEDMWESLWGRGKGSVHMSTGDTERLLTSYVAGWGSFKGAVSALLSCAAEGRRTRKYQISQFCTVEHNSISPINHFS